MWARGGGSSLAHCCSVLTAVHEANPLCPCHRRGSCSHSHPPESVSSPADPPPPASHHAVGSEGENETAGVEGVWGQQAGVKGSQLPLERSVCITGV